MPPRRAAAAKAADATAAQMKPASKTPAPKKPASKAKSSKKRVASPEQDDEDDETKDDGDDDGDDKPKKKKAKTSKSTDDVDDGATSDTVAAPDPPPKMATLIRRGTAVPVDPESGKVGTHEVLVQGDESFDGMLNQTNIGANANKFYVLQLLHPVGSPSQCILYVRWGRVGEKGASQTKGPFPTSHAVDQFMKQFKSKSGAHWKDRKSMRPKAGKYCWIERDFGDDDDKPAEAEASGSGEGKGKGKEEEQFKLPETKAPVEVQTLINLIFNTQHMNAAMQELNYDANKMPLGKLSKASILQGFSILKDLSEVINNPNGDAARDQGGFANACDTLSGHYYSVIPHAFGRLRPTPINSAERLKRELDLVDALGDMTIAAKLLQSADAETDSEGKPIHPIDARLHGLNLKTIEPLNRGSQEFESLVTYLKDSHGATHSHLKPTVESIFRVERNGDAEQFGKAEYHKLEAGKRMLLWHGSRTTNFGGILSQGLRIAPPEAPVSGYMFGKGVYFADASSKSLGYTHHHLSHNTGLLLLCEVAAKPYVELMHADYYADATARNAKALATKGVGSWQPKEWNDAADVTGNDELKGVDMPIGPLDNGGGQHHGLYYNEYIVYDTSQIKLRYLLQVKL
ncbi:hypothetical protein FRB97_005781 [Tulasnella sp. 331]|nr:hypothetical protein FRB97_005781 [Tulasnella sp. 331]